MRIFWICRPCAEQSRLYLAYVWQISGCDMRHLAYIWQSVSRK
ncbi:hypothetical protein BIFPSEUDO_03788 [Bifidobacterium pseudocatenulatum DSM 20438 = JCM 1200 = LMG 10505]|uniref:Uncharacterized protein n=1 Tax=Bifidobacterium pseudocatenulatum DSM 20438 = JCM 1200 = LMG 10505 TaxID=547043 RepID=C0BTQ6_BIFPS|nr:hypothetical protein BIFPSEUDO_03788 [Bifidobacterium pseudocatenulatum DSM 20438 = JCM 1200 = LMG 10505]